MKKCSNCKIKKALDKFSFAAKEIDKKCCICKSCSNFRVRSFHLLKKYNLTIDNYNVLLKEQNGKCAICDKLFHSFKRNLSVDHCHKTGKIRGLLCNSCNIAIGNLRDSITNLQNAIRYLKRTIK